MSPRKLHANLAMGLPLLCLGPETGNVDDAIRKPDCGISLRRKQVDDVVAFLRWLHNDPSKRSSLSANARAAFERAYDGGVMLPAFDRMIRQFTK